MLWVLLTTQTIFYNTIKKEEHEKLLKELEQETNDLEDIKDLVTNIS